MTVSDGFGPEPDTRSHVARPARIGVVGSCRRFAVQLIRRRRAVIEQVAAELEARKTIPGPELDAMAPGPVMVRQPRWWDERVA